MDKWSKFFFRKLKDEVKSGSRSQQPWDLFQNLNILIATKYFTMKLQDVKTSRCFKEKPIIFQMFNDFFVSRSKDRATCQSPCHNLLTAQAIRQWWVSPVPYMELFLSNRWALLNDAGRITPSLQMKRWRQEIYLLLPLSPSMYLSVYLSFLVRMQLCDMIGVHSCGAPQALGSSWQPPRRENNISHVTSVHPGTTLQH